MFEAFLCEDEKSARPDQRQKFPKKYGRTQKNGRDLGRTKSAAGSEYAAKLKSQHQRTRRDTVDLGTDWEVAFRCSISYSVQSTVFLFVWQSQRLLSTPPSFFCLLLFLFDPSGGFAVIIENELTASLKERLHGHFFFSLPPSLAFGDVCVRLRPAAPRGGDGAGGLGAAGLA